MSPPAGQRPQGAGRAGHPGLVAGGSDDGCFERREVNGGVLHGLLRGALRLC